MGKTEHKCCEFRWQMCRNEEGWVCTECEEKSMVCEPAGYNPFMDKSNIQEKVQDIMHFLDDSEVFHTSNGSEGDVRERMIASRCHNENRFDQYSIVKFLFDLEYPGHADYWRKIGMGIRAGSDPRDRCDCAS